MNAARLTIWDDDACRRVHEATLEVLAETGIEVRYAPAAEVFAKAGAQVDGTRVRIPAELVEAAIRSAPRDWTIKPRGGDTEPVVLDAAHTYCGTGSDVLYVCDPETRERRRVRRADVEGMAALCEKLPNIDFVMSMGLPEDAPQVDRRPRAGRRHDARHAQAAACRAARRPHPAEDAGDGGPRGRAATASGSTRCRCRRCSSTRTAPAR